MLLNLPQSETMDESELKRSVSMETKLLTKVILKKIHKTAFSKTAFQTPEGNDLLQHVPITSLAYLPKQIIITKKPEKDENDEKLYEIDPKAKKTKEPRESYDMVHKFTYSDDVMVTVQKLFQSQKCPQYIQWIGEALPKERDVPQVLVTLIQQHLPKSIAVTYTIVQASQVNLRTDKSYVIQQTGNYGKMPAAEVSIHRPTELLENVFKLQESNLLHEVLVDNDPLWEYKIKAARHNATYANKSFANAVEVNHSMIIALLPEEAITIPKEKIPTP